MFGVSCIAERKHRYVFRQANLSTYICCRKTVFGDGPPRASGKGGGKQEREALTARVRFPEHGVVAGRKREDKGGTGERGVPSGGEPPENGTASGDLGPAPEPSSASIERQFEWPQAVVGVGSKGPRDGELPVRR